MVDWYTFEDDARNIAIEAEKVCAMELGQKDSSLKVWLVGLQQPLSFQGEMAKWFWQKLGGFGEE